MSQKRDQKYRKRLINISLSIAFLAIGLSIILKVMEDNIVFYYSPSELKTKQVLGEVIRVGGLVKNGTVVEQNDGIEFIITDLEHEIKVTYKGMLPTLFAEGQGAVAKGVLKSDYLFEAKELLAKHDENYMPKEVADSLKKSGRWKG